VNDESLASLSTLTRLTSLSLGRLQDGAGHVSEAGVFGGWCGCVGVGLGVGVSVCTCVCV